MFLMMGLAQQSLDTGRDYGVSLRGVFQHLTEIHRKIGRYGTHHPWLQLPIIEGFFKTSLMTETFSLRGGRLCFCRSFLHPGERAFIEYIFTGLLSYVNAPGPCPVVEGMAMAVEAHLCVGLSARACASCSFFPV